jgi:hypothetical protein
MQLSWLPVDNALKGFKALPRHAPLRTATAFCELRQIFALLTLIKHTIYMDAWRQH